MRFAFAVAVLLMIALAPDAAAQICKKCVDYTCVTGDPPNYVNCMSNGTDCRRWTSCGGSNSGDCLDEFGNPVPCQQGSITPTWRLARVEVLPAPKREPRWRLASVVVTLAR